MVQYSSEKDAFKPIAENAADNGHLKKIKQQINAIVAQEMNKIDFKDKINQEKLVGEAYSEVISKQNFYFAVDEHKKKTNMDVTSVRAPGNPTNKP
jgi:hypothetical protein